MVIASERREAIPERPHGFVRHEIATSLRSSR
jgi:hypothetical protein